MANNFKYNPWIIDTAGATSKYAYPVWVTKLVWHEPASAGDAIQVQDYTSKATIWDKTVLAGGSGMDLEEDFGSHGLYCDGFYVPTMGSGTLKVFVK